MQLRGKKKDKSSEMSHNLTFRAPLPSWLLVPAYRAGQLATVFFLELAYLGEFLGLHNSHSFWNR